jgi:hypothetical protein
MSKDRK